MNRKKSFVTYVVTLILGGVILSGCIPAPAPEFTGEIDLKPEQLNHFVDKESGVKVEFGLPEGWQQVPLPEATIPEMKLKFVKEDTDATMQVYCQGPFVPRGAGLAVLPLQEAEKIDPKALKIWEKRSLGGGLWDTEFMAFSGSKMVGYELVGTNIYVAMSMPSCMDCCKYGIVLYGPTKNAPELEKDFMGIINSLK
jgi:hypothetical protein